MKLPKYIHETRLPLPALYLTLIIVAVIAFYTIILLAVVPQQSAVSSPAGSMQATSNRKKVSVDAVVAVTKPYDDNQSNNHGTVSTTSDYSSIKPSLGMHQTSQGGQPVTQTNNQKTSSTSNETSGTSRASSASDTQDTPDATSTPRTSPILKPIGIDTKLGVGPLGVKLKL